MQASIAGVGAALAPVAIVCGLLFFVYRGRSELAGALAGFPTVTALVTAVAGVRIGEQSLRATTIGIELGLIGTATFLLVYRSSCRLRLGQASVRAFIGYFAALCAAASDLVWEPAARMYVVGAALVLTRFGARQLVTHTPARARSPIQIVAPLASSLLLSSASKVLAAHTLGLLTPFPSTIFPLLFYTHRSDPAELPRVISGVARGLVGTLVFAITLRYAITEGIGSAWWIAMGAAAVTLLALTAVASLLRVQRARSISEGSLK